MTKVRSSPGHGGTLWQSCFIFISSHQRAELAALQLWDDPKGCSLLTKGFSRADSQALSIPDRGEPALLPLHLAPHLDYCAEPTAAPEGSCSRVGCFTLGMIPVKTGDLEPRKGEKPSL